MAAIGTITTPGKSLSSAAISAFGIVTGAVRANGNVWLFCYKSNTSVLTLETREIDPVTGIIGAVLDTNTAIFSGHPYFTHQPTFISEGVCLLSTLEGATPYDGYLTTIGVSSLGVISGPLASVVYELDLVETVLSGGVSALNKVDAYDNMFVFTYRRVRDEAGTFHFRGKIATVSIPASGASISILDVLSLYDNAFSGNVDSKDIILVADNIMAFFGNDEATGYWAHTCSINASGGISLIDSSDMGVPSVTNVQDLLKLPNGIFVANRYIAVEKIEVFSFTISDEGLYSAAMISSHQESGKTVAGIGSVKFIGGSGTENYIVLFFADTGSDPSAATYKVSDTGVFTQVDMKELVGSTAYQPYLDRVATGNMYLVRYGFSSTSYWRTYEIESVPPPTVTSLTPSTGKVGRVVDIVVTGTDFDGATTMDFGEGITTVATAVIDSTTVHVTISISPAAAGGYRDVTMTNASGSGTLTDAFYVITTEDHHSVQISGLRIPYIDEDGGKQLHVVLENLSLTTKTEGEDGEVVIDIGYEVAG